MAMSPITTVRLGNPEPAEKKEMFRESLGLPPLRSNVASQEVSQKRADYLADLERVGSDPARSALERHTATTWDSLAEPPKEMFRASLGLPPLRSASLSQTPVPPAEDLPTEEPPEPDSSFADTVQDFGADLGISALKGAVRLPAAIVGLADIPTFGAVGKALESAGYRPADAQKILEDSFSPAMKASLANVEGAEGFWEKLGATMVNGRALSNTIIESLPLMLGGAGIARGVTGALARVPGPAPLQLPAIAAAAIGEGTIGAGSAATQMREQSADGRLTGKQSAAAIGSGIGTGVLGAVGGLAARGLGLGDIDTALASGTLTGTGKAGFAKRVLGSGLTEGVFEEMPQSAQEQMWQNFAADRPITEGVAEAAATGLIAGAVTGGVFGALLFKRVKEDDRVARLLEEAGIDSATDPRFQELVAKNLSYLDIPSAEQLQETRKQRQADVTEAFGDTASTGVGVNTGTPDQQVIRRDSVIPNPETRTLDPIDGEAPVPATLPATERTPAGTVAVSGEDIVARQAGFDVESAFQIGTGQVQNRFRSQAQAETFLFGPVGQDGVRSGGYADSVPDLEFQIRRGQAAKQAGQSPFFFVESRPAQAGPATPEATPEAAPEAPEVRFPDFAAEARAWEASQGNPAQPGPSAAVSPASAWDAFGGIEFDALPAMAQQDWTEAIEEGYSPSVLANLYTNLVAEAATPQGAEAQPPAPVTATAVTPPASAVTPPAETQEPARAVEQGAQAPSPTLPKDLAGASPRYGAGKNQYTLSFESDIDKALYIAAQPTPSKRDADFRSWLRDAGIGEADIAARSKQVRDAVKSLVAGQKGGTNVVVPAQPVAGSRAKPPVLETKPEENPATGVVNPSLGRVTDEFSQALTNARSMSPSDALRLARGLQSQGLLDQQTLAVAERVASEDGATAGSVVDAFEARAKRAIAALVAEAQKPGGRKQKARPTVEQQLKEKQAQKAAQQAPRKPPNSPDETAEEWWEQNDDGKNHVAWKDLPVAKQQAWEDAKTDGDATPDFHDSIVNSVRTAGRNERSTRGTQEQDDAPKLSRKIKRDFAYVRVTSIADLVRGVRASQRKAGEQPTFSAALVRDADVARRVQGLRAIERAAALFGKQVQFFEVTNGEDFFNGAVIPGSSTIFININSNRPALSIFGHELVHAIKNEHPELYKQLTAVLKPLIDSKALIDYGSQQQVDTAEDILEEAQGDIVGSRFGEQEFWQELADLNPSMFKSLADVATRFINKLIARLRGSGSFASSTSLISDLDAARKGIAAVLNDLGTMIEEEAQQTGQQTAPSTTGGVKFSGKEPSNDIERAKERREVKAFYGTLRESIEARAAAMAELVAQMTKDGAYDGLEAGDTILTSNANGLEFRQRLLSKIPVFDKGGEYELRGKRYSAGFNVDVISGNGDSYQTQMNLEKAKGRYTKMTGPKLERVKAEFYARDNDILPYTQADGPIEIETLDDLTPKFAIKQPYAGKDLSDRTKVVTNKNGETRTITVKARVNHPTLGLPLNQNGTVTLYYPTTNEEARRVAREKTLRGDSGATRIYLTNESSGGKILNNPGAIDQNVGGANVLIHIDPDVLQLAREYEDGRKDFFIPVKEGEEFKRKMRQIKLFNENRSRDEGLHPDRTLKQITEGITKAVSEYSAMTAKEKARRLSDAKDNLKRLHNIGTLLSVNGKLEKTNMKGYEDLVKVDQDVLSMGLGMAAAQRINNLQKLNTCPNRAICQDLCLGSTSGQNQLYGGDGPFRAGPRLAQYLKTEALVVSPEDFSVLLYSEVESLQRQAKRDGYKPSVRLNVTTDFHPDTFAALIRAFPDVMFYDYTKLDSRPIAPNHHLTYSSTGASQVVNGKVVFNQHSNWDRMVRNLLQGRNVAMAFTSRQDIPEFVVDEATGRTFKVWDGDLYDARFIDPKQSDGIGMIIGLTNKDRTTKPEDSAKKHNGFFMDYDKARDGSTLTILDQSRFTAKDNGQPPLPVGTQSIRFSRKQPSPLGFVSALENGIDQLSMNSAQPTGWKDAIKGLINKGAVKADEVEWSGISDWLALQNGKVTKEQLSAYLERGGVKVVETSYTQSDTTYSNWVQPGGRNYREILLYLPESDQDAQESALTENEKAAVEQKKNYISSHWRVPNIIAHIRISDHIDEEGKRVLFVEEIQSDWGQEGKKKGFGKKENIKRFAQAVDEYDELGKQERALQFSRDYLDWAAVEEFVYQWGGSANTVKGLVQAQDDIEDGITAIERGKIYDPDEIDLIRRAAGSVESVLGMNDPQSHIDRMRSTVEAVEEIRGKRADLRAEIRMLNGLSSTLPGPFVAARRFTVFKDGKELVTKNKEGKDVVHRYDNMDAAKAAAAKHGGEAVDMGQQANTDGWLSLALKRVISLASKEGYDRVAIVAGKQAAKMFSLRNVADSVYVIKNGNGTYTVSAQKERERGGLADVLREDYDLSLSGIEEIYGKGFAQQVEAQTKQEFEYRGDQLEVGGEGMTGFYDHIVPAALKKLLPKVGGGKIAEVKVNDTLFRKGKNAPQTYPGSYVSQIGFDVTPAMQDKVEEGLPTFSRRRYEEQFDDLPADTREVALKKAVPTGPTIRERLEAMKPNLAMRLTQGMFDKVRSVRDISEKAYMQLRLSSSVDGAVEALLHFGQVFNDDGALNIKKGTRGLIEVMQPLGGETDRFLMWIAANRAENLKAQDRELFFKDDEIKKLKKLNLGTMKNGKQRLAVYAEAMRGMNDLNRSVLDVARNSGLIDEAAYQRFASDIWYVPFYRYMEEDGTLSAASTASGSVNQYFSKLLKGSERPLNDLMENVLMNWSHILSSSMKNLGSVEALKAADNLGGVVTRLDPVSDKLGKDKSGKTHTLSDTVKVMERGKTVHYMIDDPLLLQSLSAVASIDKSNFLLNIGRAFKTTLTRTVALSPTFKTNNLIRDAVQSIGLTELDYNPVANVYQGIKTYRNDRGEALAGGGVFTMGNAFDGDRASAVKRLVRKGANEADIIDTPEKAAKLARDMWDVYDHISDAMENSNRLALYKQVREKGASHLEAAYAARDLQDFTSQGAWAAVRYLNQILPYFNARMQGLYKMGRDGIVPAYKVLAGTASQSDRKKAAKFTTVTGAVAAAGLLLYLAQKDDDDWKQREDWDRDMFFWFKLPGTDRAIRIPKPFEIGSIATVAERVLEQIVDKDVDGAVFGKRMLSLLTDTFAVNIIPQYLRPMADVARNKDGLSGAPIESLSQRRLSAELRTNPRTSGAGMAMGKVNSMLAEGIGALTGADPEKMKLSPVQYDYMIKSYLGWVGTVIQQSTYYAAGLAKDGEMPAMRVDDMLWVGNYVKSLPANESRYVTDFYATAEKAARATADFNNLIDKGEIEEAKARRKDDAAILSMASAYSDGKQTMSDISDAIKRVQRDERMSAEDKRKRMDDLYAKRNLLAKRIELARIRKAANQ